MVINKIMIMKSVEAYFRLKGLNYFVRPKKKIRINMNKTNTKVSQKINHCNIIKIILYHTQIIISLGLHQVKVIFNNIVKKRSETLSWNNKNKRSETEKNNNKDKIIV